MLPLYILMAFLSHSLRRYKKSTVLCHSLLALNLLGKLTWFLLLVKQYSARQQITKNETALHEWVMNTRGNYTASVGKKYTMLNSVKVILSLMVSKICLMGSVKSFTSDQQSNQSAVPVEHNQTAVNVSHFFIRALHCSWMISVKNKKTGRHFFFYSSYDRFMFYY